MSHTARTALAVGRAAGTSPLGAVIVVCAVLWLVGLGLLAVALAGLVWWATGARDRAADWWETVGPVSRFGLGCAGLIGAYVATTGDMTAVVPMAAVGGPIVVWKAWRAWRDFEWREHVREYVLPLHESLTGPGGPLPELAEANPLAWLDVPVDMLEAEGGLVLTMPRGPIPNDTRKAAILSTVTTVLGLSDVRAEWRFEGTDRWLRLLSIDRSVPDLVEFDDVFRALLADAPPHRKLIGFTKGDKPFYIDQRDENPHTLLSAPTGAGKTTVLGVMAADELHKGGEVAVADIKFGSMRWLFGLPGVTYCRTVEAIHELLADRLAAELLRRREVLGAAAWDEEPVFPRLFFIVEEMASLNADLQDFWIEERARLKADAKEAGITLAPPTKSPALKAYRQGLLMGRQLGVFFVVVDQRGEAKDVGGSLARANLGTKLLGWPEQATWKLHASQHAYVPHNNHKGRWHVVRGRYLNEVQVVRTDSHQLRAWATSGVTPSSTLSGSYPGRTSSTSGFGGGHVLGQRHLTAVPDDAEPTAVSLRDAAIDTGDDGGLVPVKLATLQRYARPDRRARNGFPEPVGTDPTSSAQLFDVEALLAWSRNRPSDERRRREAEA